MANVKPRYVRKRTKERLRHSTNFLNWLEQVGARLGIGADEVFNDLLVAQGMTYEQINSLPTPEDGDGDD